MHLFADWPGHCREPQGTVAVLQAAGGELNASGDATKMAETPLHLAASNHDVELVDALLDAGADVNVPGCIINGLGPVADAAIFGGIWAGRRLVEGGAVTNIYQAAALVHRPGRTELEADSPPDAERVTAAFWAARESGNQDIAELLIGHGADINWLGRADNPALDQARDADADDLAVWLSSSDANQPPTSVLGPRKELPGRRPPGGSRGLPPATGKRGPTDRLRAVIPHPPPAGGARPLQTPRFQRHALHGGSGVWGQRRLTCSVSKRPIGATKRRRTAGPGDGSRHYVGEFLRPRSSDAGFAPSPLCGACRTAIGTLLTDDNNLVEGPTFPRVKVLRLALGR
jgi:uncharacterized protein